MTFRIFSAFCALLAVAPAAQADEFTDVLDGAIEAYEAGEYGAARDDLDYAMKLLADMKSEGLADFLPKAMPGWQRSEADAEGLGMGIGMFGGGTSAAATYSNPDGALTISLIADSPMLASFSAMISGLSTATGGRPFRIQRVEFVDNEGDLQGMVDDRILVTVSGDASVESKKAYLEAMNFQSLRDF